MKILLLSTLILLNACISSEPLLGKWAMELDIQNKKIPFILEFKDDGKAILYNNLEEIKLSYSVKNDNIIVPILGFDAALELSKTGNTLRGFWKKYNRTPEYKVSTFGMKLQRETRLDFKEELKLSSNWEMTFIGEKSSQAILLFTKTQIKNGTNLHASVITQTGDYRYLTPMLKDKKLVLYGFDGAYSFYFEGNLTKDYEGMMYSGPSWSEKFKAKVNPNFKLKNPEQITSYTGDITKLQFKDLEGKVHTLKESLGSVQVLQIFGSWCPNCIDETQFIKRWRSKNQDLDIKFSILAFERSPNKRLARIQLKKAVKSYSIDYPILIGGYTREDKVSTALPGLENFISFPTTIYIDKKGRVRKVLASFQGPATGIKFEEFSKNFDLFLKKLNQE